MSFNEDSRVKIPTILHLIRLGFKYLSLKGANWDINTNIFIDVFYESIARINDGIAEDEIKRVFEDISIKLENQDLGRAFYEDLINQSGTRLIDFENFENNSFHVVTELPYQKDDDNFRPDIILLINGMPLVFIEVKKPNNKDGVIAERKRITDRFQNKKFLKFVNLTQLMIFSNNMNYDEIEVEPIQGAFYASSSYGAPIFNYFREEETLDLEKLLLPEQEENIDLVLKDTNYVAIKNNTEFHTNNKPNSYTNQICTSLLSKERLAFILRYGIAYVEETKGLEKHIMRYPQIFATKAIQKKLNEGIRKGIIWHTQGSGKTSLAYFNVKHLTDYFQSKNIVAKFYFIVDRIDLLTQASKEFRSRGLIVHNIDSKEAFAKEIKSTSAIHNNSGKAEITVVNIHKFADEADVVNSKDYQLNVQRVYFLDEVHRSYNPKGSFLSNLNESDINAIKIGLTGTPLLGEEFNSKAIFGDYIHKYYYNASIADGYTLRLIREEIDTKYKLILEEAIEKIEVLKGKVERKVIYSHPRFVEPMLDFIVEDFEKSRLTLGDNSIGGMVVCDSSEQAKTLYEIFNSKYAQKHQEQELSMAAEGSPSYGDQQKAERKVKRAALILHDIGSKDDRKLEVDLFKEGKIDFVFVYNMLLTGFDAKRLKKLYICRVIKSHNLLQTLTRVNRSYNKHKYGYVVDFADIQTEFDKTNKAYFDELQAELGNDIEHFSNLFKSQEEIKAEIVQIKDILFPFETRNAEIFTQQISEIQDRMQVLEIVKALNNAKSLYNLIRLSGNYELLDKLDFRKLSVLARVANDHLAKINQKKALESEFDTTNILNIALEDVLFLFKKISSKELILADKLKDFLRKTREMMGNNFDQKDPEFVSLKDELERLFKKGNMDEVSQEELENNIVQISAIYDRAKEINRKNKLVQAKFDQDTKYARVFKELLRKGDPTKSESQLMEALKGLKQMADLQILQNSKVLDNDAFVEKMLMRLVIHQFTSHDIKLNPENTKFINNLVVKEYLNEYRGKAV